MSLLQIIPSNPFEYGILGLLALGCIVVIRYLVNKEKIFQEIIKDKESDHSEEMRNKRAEYVRLIEKKEEELKECREELKQVNEQRFEIVRQNIELSIELMSVINDFKKNGNSGDK